MTSSSLPKTGPLELFARARVLLDVDGFVSALPGPAVLVRLDERGGHDEGARWAFPSLDEIDIHNDGVDGNDNVFFDPASAADSDEATATGPAQPPLAIPPARDRAAAFVVPAAGGRLGRAASSVVRVGERSVSRRHALLGTDKGVYSLLDLESDNGTGINGMPLVPGTPQSLRSGDVVHLGDVSFVFLDARALYSHLPALTGS